MVPAVVHRLFLCAFCACAAARVAAQTVWDPTTNFSTTTNPNGVWSYGSMDTGFTTFSAYSNFQFASGLGGSPLWYTPGGDLTPNVWFNTSTQSYYNVQPGQLALHPGPSTQPSVLRWTSPVTGLVQLSGQFFAGDIGSMALAVFLNDTTVANTLWSGTDSGSFNLSVNVVPNDTLNFAVFGSYAYGNTPLALNITGVPEPSSFALLAIAVVPFACWQRRRVQRQGMFGKSMLCTRAA